jgi:acetyl-CoA carboxylase biotin carboxyl carrier protein
MGAARELDFERVRGLARLASSLGLSELTSEEDGMRVTVHVTPPMAAAVSQPALTGRSPKALPRAPERELGPAERGLQAVHAPMAGVFYRTPSPESPPYVEVGSVVQEGDILGLIEAMKVFNEITAEFGGEVAEIPLGNGELVSLGQPLLWLHP